MVCGVIAGGAYARSGAGVAAAAEAALGCGEQPQQEGGAAVSPRTIGGKVLLTMLGKPW